MQEHQVVRCVECKTFQVDIVKKVNKWSCKVCGQKQSVFKVFFKSYSAKECRQKLDELRLKAQEKQSSISSDEENIQQEQVKSRYENSAVKNSPNERENLLNFAKPEDFLKSFENVCDSENWEGNSDENQLLKLSVRLDPETGHTFDTLSSTSSSSKISAVRRSGLVFGKQETEQMPAKKSRIEKQPLKLEVDGNSSDDWDFLK